MLGNCIHHDTECQDVASHDKDRKEQLADTEKFSSKSTHKYIARIGQVLDVRIFLMELSNNIASISSKETEADNQYESSGDTISIVPWMSLGYHDTYGTRPSCARVAGNDKTPSETDSAIMTGLN